MNFNFQNQPEYKLNESLIEEMINLYGIKIKYIITEKINQDMNVFGDYSHLKSDGDKIYDIFALPETTEDWEDAGSGFSGFGLVNLDNITLFISKKSLSKITTFEKTIGDIIVLPNNKIMEITSVDATVPGINNLFTEQNAKSVYKISCKPYEFKIINELDDVDISVEDGVEYETLDNYFKELITEKDEQDAEAEVKEQTEVVIKNNNVDTKTQKPIIDKTETSPFGEFD